MNMNNMKQQKKNENNNNNGVMRKADIDTSLPFRSVKEAVSLYAHKLHFSQDQHYTTTNLTQSEANENFGLEYLRHVGVEAELEETRQELQRVKEETMSMTHCLSSLEDELQRTKLELLHLKQQETANCTVEQDVHEDVKFVENLTDFDTKNLADDDEEENLEYFYVMPPQEVEKLEKHPSLGNKMVKKKNKKKPLIPLIKCIFPRKKGNQ